MRRPMTHRVTGSDPCAAPARRLGTVIALLLVAVCAARADAQTGTFVDRQSPTDLRVVDYNINWDSIFEDGDPDNHEWREYDMSDEFVRIVQALNPDILCLQEINFDRPAQDVADILDAALPLGDGIGWRSYIGSDDVILSRYDLSMTANDTIPTTNRDHAQALIDLPDGQVSYDLYLINAHFKAGGTSTDIARRQQHADAIVNWIRDCQNTGGNINLPSDTPIVVLGDLNVYDTDPAYQLTTLITGDIVDEGTYGSDYPPDWDATDNTDALPLHNAVGPDTYTWRDDSGSFNPGALDRVIYTDSVIAVSYSFVLNTTTMTAPELAATGLQANDVVLDPGSGYFDHLPIVVDFALPGGCTGDEDCDDGNPCTDDTCVDQQCVFTPNDANSCDDNLFCTGTESCVSGDCVSGVDPCALDEMCDEDTDTCLPVTQTVYDFTGITSPSSTHIAQDGEIDVADSMIENGTFPARRDTINGWNNWSEASSAEYAALVGSDDSRYQGADPGSGDNAAMLFEFYVAEDPADIAQIDVSVELGRYESTDLGWVYIWNYTTGSYLVLGSQSGTADQVVAASITSNPGEYVESGTGELSVFVVNEDVSDWIRVDDISVTITAAATGDADGDAVPDGVDNCPTDYNPGQEDCNGDGEGDACEATGDEQDDDGDGTCNGVDGCPNDPDKIDPGICGCGTPDTDTDGDLTPDCNDLCPNDPDKIDPGVCGCGTPDTDTDGDQTPDCNDGCPNDPDKIDPGICGCGEPDTDTDGDLTPDCNDLCPNDPDKVDPGICGCGTPDTDTDGDLTPDCNDNCPYEPALVEPELNHEHPATTCSDGIDNDCDGYTDGEDIDCQFPDCTCGDLNDSGGPVDLSDFSEFSVCFGLRAPTAQCPSELFECADLNQDNWINNSDFSSFQVLFGGVSTNSPPNCAE